MIRARFKCNAEDPRPVLWPIKHPYWVTGTAEQHCTVVAYADDLEQLISLWPDATDVVFEEVPAYVFSNRFPKPDWFAPETADAITENPGDTNDEPCGQSQLRIRMLADEEAVASGPTFSAADIIIKNLRTYISLWDPVDDYVRKHPTTKLGRLVPECALQLLQEGDETAKKLAAVREELQAEHSARVQAEEALELADRLNEELMEQTARLREYERSHEKNVVRIRNLEEHISSIADHMGVSSSTVPYQTKNRIMFALTQAAEILGIEKLNPDNVKPFAGLDAKHAGLNAKYADLQTKYAEALREKQAAVDRYQRDVYGLNNEGDPIGGEPAGGYANELKACREELEKLRAEVASKRYSTDQYLEIDQSQVPVAYYIPGGNGYNARITLDEKIARHWSSHRAAKIVELIPKNRFADTNELKACQAELEKLRENLAGLTDARINELTHNRLGQWPSFEAQSWACKVVKAVLAPESFTPDVLPHENAVQIPATEMAQPFAQLEEHLQTSKPLPGELTGLHPSHVDGHQVAAEDKTPMFRRVVLEFGETLSKQQIAEIHAAISAMFPRVMHTVEWF